MRYAMQVAVLLQKVLGVRSSQFLHVAPGVTGALDAVSWMSTCSATTLVSGGGADVDVVAQLRTHVNVNEHSSMRCNAQIQSERSERGCALRTLFLSADSTVFAQCARAVAALGEKL